MPRQSGDEYILQHEGAILMKIPFRHKKEVPNIPDDVVDVKVRWDDVCFVRYYIPSSEIPQVGERLIILTPYVNIEGDVHSILRLNDVSEVELGYVEEELGTRRYFRAKTKLVINLRNASTPVLAAKDEIF